MELHAGHHQVVQWLGLSFNIDTLIATWITMAIVIIISVLATRNRALVPSGVQNVVETLLPTLHAVTSPTADINTTAALALCSSFIVWGMGIKVKGLSYFNHFLQPYKAMLVLNIFEEIAKPITLAFRLFGNIVAGEILLEILYNLPWFVPVPWVWIAFSLFIGIIQAFIFTVLTANYLGMALSEEN